MGALPGGSGNAIVKNVCERSGEDTCIESACYIIAKGRTIQTDLL